jgi:allophanate hydrolase
MTERSQELQLDLPRLTADYTEGTLTPSNVVDAIFDAVAERGKDGVWICLAGRQETLARARYLEELPAAERARLPLWGVPFSVKDCIDVAGLPTTAACPSFSYLPSRSNLAVERLLSAGGILIGKTNMDQFATGLVGVRSPHGVARNPFNAAYIPGGSSSGAAVSVAAGLVSLALGTDTGGSGRVPAAFNNVVGLKPTRGLISGLGTVPACRSIETISVFALTVPDAQAAFRVIHHYDSADPFSRVAALRPMHEPSSRFRFGIPGRDFLDFFGDTGAASLFDAAIDRLQDIGGVRVDVDFTPFLEINDLLFRGPWLAERYGALRHIVDEKPNALLPVTRNILLGGKQISGADVFAGQQRLNVLKRQVDQLWRDIDTLVVPTTGTIYAVSEIDADPINLNARLGRYTNFVNLADLAAIAVPNGFLPNGLPQGVTLIVPAFADRQVADLADRFDRTTVRPLGARNAGHPDHSRNLNMKRSL